MEDAVVVDHDARRVADGGGLGVVIDFGDAGRAEEVPIGTVAAELAVVVAFVVEIDLVEFRSTGDVVAHSALDGGGQRGFRGRDGDGLRLERVDPIGLRHVPNEIVLTRVEAMGDGVVVDLMEACRIGLAWGRFVPFPVTGAVGGDGVEVFIEAGLVVLLECCARVAEQRVGAVIFDFDAAAEIECDSFERDANLLAGDKAGDLYRGVALPIVGDIGVAGSERVGIRVRVGDGCAGDAEAVNRELTAADAGVVGELRANEVGPGGKIEGLAVGVIAGRDCVRRFRVVDDDVHRGIGRAGGLDIDGYGDPVRRV